MNNDHEPVFAALLAHLVAKVALTFTGDTTEGSPIISNASSLTGLFAGLPVFGDNVPRATVISSIDALTSAITLSNDVTADGTASAFKIGFLTTGRRADYWERVDNQPAMFLRHTATEDDFGEHIFARTKLEAEIWIYARGGEDPEAVPDVLLNQLTRSVREAFAADSPTGMFTIGGLAFWCRIEGRSEFDPGDIDKQAIARIPVTILLP